MLHSVAWPVMPHMHENACILHEYPEGYIVVISTTLVHSHISVHNISKDTIISHTNHTQATKQNSHLIIMCHATDNRFEKLH